MRLRLLCLVAFALPLLASAQMAMDPEKVITVTGSAQVFASPDEAVVRLGVLQQGATAGEAQTKASAITQRFLNAIIALKIAKENVQTSRISLYPMYSNPKPGETQKISGYQASNVLSVRLNDFSLVGKVIDAGVAAGVNNVEGIDFNLRNGRGARAQAFKDAVADARSKADAIAEALGVRIMGVYDVRTDSAGYTPPPRSFGGAKMMDAMATPVEPGQMEVGVSVTIRYRIG